jgi:hypothetical protein
MAVMAVTSVMRYKMPATSAVLRVVVMSGLPFVVAGWRCDLAVLGVRLIWSSSAVE